MEWLTCIKTSIDYIESHIKENISIDDVASNSYVSSYYLQVGFNIMTGYSIGEYIRNRFVVRKIWVVRDRHPHRKISNSQCCFSNRPHFR